MSALENKEDDAAWDRMEAELSRLRDLVREMREALNFYGQNIFRRVSNGDLCVQTPIDHDCGDRARSAIAKADAALKESGEPVKYGCHHNDTVTDECAIDTNSPLCITARALAKNGFQKEQCSYWRPIK